MKWRGGGVKRRGGSERWRRRGRGGVKGGGEGGEGE